jgi:hypothetical protein
MGLDKLKRVMQCLWLKKNEKNLVTFNDVRKAIYENVGTDERTVKNTLKPLKSLGWLKRKNREQFIVSSDYLVEDF